MRIGAPKEVVPGEARVAMTPDSAIQLQNNGRNFPPNFLHESWRDYLYWDTELQS